jgi:hypothetical protein
LQVYLKSSLLWHSSPVNLQKQTANPNSIRFYFSSEFDGIYGLT